jgi:hypothetical protein
MLDLNTLIPNVDQNWNISGRFLRYKKYANIPVAYIDDDIVYVFFNLKIKRQIVKVIKHIMSISVEFYIDSPEFSNPAKSIHNQNSKVISHYLFSYSDMALNTMFKEIGFDIIKNLVLFCEKNNCIDLLKVEFEKMKKIILHSYYDYYTSRTNYDYPIEIREEFENLYRDIQISRIV